MAVILCSLSYSKRTVVPYFHLWFICWFYLELIISLFISQCLNRTDVILFCLNKNFKNTHFKLFYEFDIDWLIWLFMHLCPVLVPISPVSTPFVFNFGFVGSGSSRVVIFLLMSYTITHKALYLISVGTDAALSSFVFCQYPICLTGV